VEEVRLWKIDQQKPGAARAARVDGINAVAAEKLLEDILAHSPEVLMEGLTIIGRQNETAGGPLDLLGLDDDGKLVVFELKRGELTRDAVAQVLDYASWLGALESEELSGHITDMSGRYGTEKIANFADWYRENYAGKRLEDIGRPRMVLVGLGVDARTKRMVEFLAAADLDISLITFYGFTENGQTLLARQVEVEARATKQTNEYRATKAANEERFQKRLSESGLQAFYSRLMQVLEHSLGGKGTPYPNANGHTFYFPDQTDSGTATNRAYAGLSLPDGPAKAHKVLVTLQPRALKELQPQLVDEVANKLGAPAVRKVSGILEFALNGLEPPSTLDAGLEALGTAVSRSWEERLKTLEASSQVEGESSTTQP
jgi:Endonuclease NucS